MSLELTGTVKTVLPLETGTSKAGKDWKKQSFVVTYKDGEYEKDVCFTSMQEKVLEYIGKLGVGQTATVKFNIESKEFNGKYYTDAKPWSVKAEGEATEQHVQSGEPTDQLPF